MPTFASSATWSYARRSRVMPATAAPVPSATTARRAVSTSASGSASVTAAYDGVPPTSATVAP